MTETLEARVRRHHDEDKPSDGMGKHERALTIRELQEVRPGVVAVLDSTNEIDLFVDTALLVIRNDPPSPYASFVERIREAWQNYHVMDQRYGMICVVEDRWNPYFARKETSFEAAAEAAAAFFEPSDAKQEGRAT